MSGRTTRDLSGLTPPERMMGYLRRVAELAEVGARLRANGREDHEWSLAEANEFEEKTDATDAWWYALAPEEHRLVKPISIFMNDLGCGFWPMHTEVIGRFFKEWLDQHSPSIPCSSPAYSHTWPAVPALA